MAAKYVKELVKTILQHPYEFPWDVQGLGMLRLYLPGKIRLHVWDEILKVPNVSPLHTHPWDLESQIVAGEYKQNRYYEMKEPGLGSMFKKATIKCGKDACLMGELENVSLIEADTEIYLEGDVYSQRKDEIHKSTQENGTVTLVTRAFYSDTEHANVYWKKGPFVSAEPRVATPKEIEFVTQRSLAYWF